MSKILIIIRAEFKVPEYLHDLNKIYTPQLPIFHASKITIIREIRDKHAHSL